MNRMKKLSFLIIPATAMFFVACNTEAPAPSQADIDAQVEAKVKAATDQLKAECDSRIMAAAQLKKDSILVKMGSKPAPAPAPKPAPAPTKPPVKPVKPTPPPPPPPAPAPPKQGNQGKVSDQKAENQGKIGGKTPSGEEIVPVNHGKKK
jgi:hypothetical protein